MGDYRLSVGLDIYIPLVEGCQCLHPDTTVGVLLDSCVHSVHPTDSHPVGDWVTVRSPRKNEEYRRRVPLAELCGVCVPKQRLGS